MGAALYVCMCVCGSISVGKAEKFMKMQKRFSGLPQVSGCSPQPLLQPILIWIAASAKKQNWQQLPNSTKPEQKP